MYCSASHGMTSADPPHTRTPRALAHGQTGLSFFTKFQYIPRVHFCKLGCQKRQRRAPRMHMQMSCSTYTPGRGEPLRAAPCGAEGPCGAAAPLIGTGGLW